MQETITIKTIFGIIKKEGFGRNRYVKEVNYAKHYFKKLEGYGISETELRKAIKEEVNRIILIEEKGERRTLLTSYVEDWLKKGKIYNNMGDKQVILRKTEMREGQSP